MKMSSRMRQTAQLGLAKGELTRTFAFLHRLLCRKTKDVGGKLGPWELLPSLFKKPTVAIKIHVSQLDEKRSQMSNLKLPLKRTLSELLRAAK